MLEDDTPKLGRRPRYSLDEVLDAAERLPFDRLTMTALGGELGLVTSALYRYVRDRDDLVAKLTARLSDLLVVPDESLPWDEWLTEMALGMYELVVAHPVLADVRSWVAIFGAKGSDLIQASERVLGAAGLGPRDVVMLHTAATNLALALASGQVQLGPLAAAEPVEHQPGWEQLSTRTALVGALELLVDGATRRLERARG